MVVLTRSLNDCPICFQVNRLPVLSGGALVGVLTRSDVVSALARFGTSTPV